MHLSLKIALGRPASAPLRLLQEFGGASAAYSLRNVGSGVTSVVRVRRASDNSEKDFSAADVSSGAMTGWVNAQIVPPLDIRELVDGERTGDLVEAAAAYSLRNLSASYTGNVVDVRRSSDDAEESFTAAEVADGTLTDWVNAVETVGAESNFSSTISPYNLYQADGSTASLNETIGGETGALKITSQGGSSHLRYLGSITNLSVNTTIKISIKAYIPSSNTSLDGLTFSLPNFTVTSGQPSNTIPTDTWTTVTVEGTSSNPSTSNSWRIYPRIRSAGDVIYLKNYRITQDIADGFVSQWYDQSGNDNHATQGTDAKQPKIVDAGSLVSGGIDFDGVNDGLFTASNLTDTLQSATIFALTQDDVTSGVASMVRIRPNGDPGNFDGFVWEKTTGDTYGGNTLFEGDNKMVSANIAGQGIRTTTENLNTLIYQPSQILAYENGTLDETLTNVRAGSVPIGDVTLSDQLWIGQNFDDNARPFNGTMSEVIIYFTDQSDNRTAFEANIGETYGINLPSGVDTGYDEVDGFVETWYDQSGNGNDAVQQVSGSQPKIVDAGVLVSDGIDFDGNDTLSVSGDPVITASSSGTYSAFSVQTVATSEGGYLYGNASSSNGSSAYALADKFTITNYFFADLDNIARSSGQNLLSAVYNNGDAGLLVNGAGTMTDAGTYNFSAGTSDFIIGNRNGGSSDATFLTGSIQEIIIYPSDQSDNRTAIETNINNQYSIY